MAQALYRKWRPQVWQDVVGQESVTRTLRNAVSGARLSHAYLFAGPRGCGKTTSARLLAKAANCLADELNARPCNACHHCQAVNEGRFLDLVEIDGATHNGVEQIRDLCDKVHFAPNQGRFKVYIIDEVHMLSTAAFNALLKTLEEPPAHVIFVLATTEVHRIPATVLSRCQRHEFRRIPVADIVARLQALAEAEGLSAEAAALQLVARQATGSLRDAESLLDLLASSGTVTLERAQAVLGTAASEAVQQLVDCLASRDTAAGLELIARSVDAGVDSRQFARQAVDYLRGLLLVRLGNAPLVDALPEARARMAQQAQRFTPDELLHALRAFNAAAADARSSWQPQLPLELALVELTVPAPEGLDRSADAPVVARREAATPVPPPRAAPPPAAERAAPLEAEPSGAALSLDDVTRQWKSILVVMRRIDSRTQGLLTSCRPVGLDGHVVIVAAHEFVKQKLEREDNRARVIQAITEVMGVPVGLRCVLAGAAGKGSGDGSAAGGMVSAALDLGAQIVDSQPVES